MGYEINASERVMRRSKPHLQVRHPPSEHRLPVAMAALVQITADNEEGPVEQRRRSKAVKLTFLCDTL